MGAGNDAVDHHKPHPTKCVTVIDKTVFIHRGVGKGLFEGRPFVMVSGDQDIGNGKVAEWQRPVHTVLDGRDG